MDMFLEKRVFFNSFFKNFHLFRWSPSLLFFKEKKIGQIRQIFDLET
jgi:hypothetical protein